jgi:hypothetical protein
MKKAIITICLFCTINAYAVIGDINSDGFVDTLDLHIFADEWLTSGTLCDFVDDDMVNFLDFAAFANNWTGDTLSPPTKAENPMPVNNATNIPISQSLSWCAVTATCDVYFGTTNPPPFVQNQTTLTYSPVLVYNTKYYWRIDTQKNGHTQTGDVWDFTTASNVAPVTVNKSVDANTYEIKSITLTAADNENDKLKYYITQGCNDGDAYLQDPASCVGKIKKFPHLLRNNGNTVWLSANAAETLTFQYKAYDGYQYSNEANCVVTVSANPQKQLSFDGSGYVTVADSCDFELINKRGIAMYVKTRSPKGTLCSKYAAGQAGYVFQLINGRPTLRLYSSSGLVSTVTGKRRIDNGLWNNIGFAYDCNGYAEIDINYEAIGNNNYDYTASGWIGVSAIDYNNTANFIIGENFKGEIDNVRVYLFDSYTGYSGDNFYEFRGYVTQTRANAGDLYQWSSFIISPAAIVRFHCDYDGTNNTAAQIYDDLANHYTGAISNSVHCKYEPYNPFWMNMNVLQYRYKKPTVIFR